MTIEESGIQVNDQGAFKLGATITAELPEWSGSVAIFFDYLAEESNTAEASITDNYVESNYSVQDHIAVKPRIYRLKGYVGEVIFKQPTKFVKAISDWANNHPVLKNTLEKLKPINQISGIVSNYTQAAINVVNQVESSYNRYKQIYEQFKNINQEFVGIRQKTVSTLLLNLLEQRIPVKLTDLAFEDDIPGRENRLYFLQSVSSRQGDNRFISDYEVTIKEFRIVGTILTEVDASKFAFPVATQKTNKAKNGQANQEKVEASLENKIVPNTQNPKMGYTTLKEGPPPGIINKLFYNIKKSTDAYNKALQSRPEWMTR